MSREIDLTKRLSEDELRYLVDRDRWDDLRTNADNLGLDAPNLPSARGIRQQVPRRQLRNTDAFDDIAKSLGVSVTKEDDEASPPADSAATAEEGDKPVDYTKLTVPQLKEELDKRRKEYELAGDAEAVKDVTYDTKATKPDLVAQLQLDDEAAGAEDADGDGS
jgi:hypothetical protein